MRLIVSTVVFGFTLFMIDAVFFGGNYFDALRDFAEQFRGFWH